MKLSPGKTYIMHFDFDSCNTSKYPLLTSNELIFTSDELIHAIITCGMPRYYLTNSALNERIPELLYKINVIECALEEEADTTDPTRSILVLSKKLKYLDQSERAVLSYYLGMFFTKLISKKIFSIQYLVHLSIAELNKTITFSTDKRPDLIGFNLSNNEYSVFEAKGRINFIKATLDKAFNQTKAIKEISGYKPTLRVANMTYFKKRILNSYIKDPEAKGDLCIDFTPEAVLKQYYQPIFELVTPDSIAVNQQYYSVNINLPEQRNLTISVPNFISTIFDEKFNLSKFKEHAKPTNPSDDFITIHYE